MSLKSNITKLQDCDFDPVFIIDTNKKDKNIIKGSDTGDLYQLSSKFYDLLNFKITFILCLVYYILNSDRFIEFGLERLFTNSYDKVNDKITEKGIILSGIILSLCYLILDLLDKKKII